MVSILFGYHKRTYHKLAYTTSFQAINKLVDGPTSLFERGGPSFYYYMYIPTTKRVKNQLYTKSLSDGGELLTRSVLNRKIQL